MVSLKKLLPTSLMGRSLLILIAPIIIVQIVTTFVFFDRHWERVVQRQSASVAGEIAMIVAMIEQTDKGEDLQQLTQMKRYAGKHLGMGIALNADEDQLERHGIYPVQSFWEGVVASIFSNILHTELKTPFSIRMAFHKKRVYVSVLTSKGLLNVTLHKARLFSSSGYIYLLWVLGSALILLFLAIVFMRNQVRPIRKLAVAAERFGRGLNVSKFKVEGAREVRQAGQAFVNMAARIRTQLDQRALMLAGVSHDLRTPLTRLRLELSMMQGAEQCPSVKAMREDLTEMERMINGYLDFVRGGGDEEAEEVNLSEMLGNIVQSHKRTGATIHDSVQNDITVSIRPIAVTRCINNIISNGLKHGDALWVALYMNGAQDLRLIIEDNGEGIPEAMYEEVFKPFYRADTARSESQGSVGLGLSIAMDIIHAHGGRIWLDESKKHGGLAVHISLPV